MLLLCILFAVVFSLAAFGFWLWMLIDCATKEPDQGNDKVVWILVIVLLHFLGALVYFFARRLQRKERFGG